MSELLNRILSQEKYQNFNFTNIEKDEEEEERLRQEEEERKRLEEERLRKEEEKRRLEEQQAKILQQQQSNPLLNRILSQEKYQIKKDFLGNDLPPEMTQEGSAVELRRKLRYGAAQEPTIAGSLYRLGKARFESWMSDKTYKEAAREIERERQKALGEQFPELINEPEDAAIIAGRLGVALVDPVTFLMPWTKLAKAGKLATTTGGAAFSATDVALREEALYGQVSPVSLGLATGLGATSSYIGSLFSPFSKKADDIIEITGTTGEKISKKIDIDDSSVNLNINNKTRKALNELQEEAPIQHSKVISNILDHETNAGSIYSQINIIKTEVQNLADDVTKITNEIKGKGTTELREKAKNGLNQKISDKNKAITKLEKELHDVLLDRLPKDFAELGWQNFMDAYKKGILTKDFAAAVMQESIRPLVGMTGGFAYGVTTADEDSTMNYVYGSMIIGAFMGHMQKRIQVSNFEITKANKNLVDKFINYGEDVYRKSYYTTLKRLTAGTHSAKLQAGIGAVRDFGARMFKVQGAGIKSGVPIKESVEESKQVAINYWTSEALPQIFKDYSIKDIMAAGRLVNQRGMREDAKHSFLKTGDSDNKIANQIADEIIHITEEFKKYTTGVGINLKEEDFYGLTQLIKNPSRLNSDEGFLDIKEAFRIQFVNDIKSEKLVFNPKQRNYIHTDDIKKDGYQRTYDKEFVDDIKKEINASVFRPDIPTNKINTAKLDKWTTNKANSYIDGSTKTRQNSLWAEDIDYLSEKALAGNVFRNSANEEENLVITAARHFENERVLYDQEARAYLTKNGYFVDDPIDTLSSLFNQTIPVVEFARVFGSKGEGIIDVFKNIKSQVYAGQGSRQITSLKKIADQQIKDVKDSVDAYFGLFGKSNESVLSSEAAVTTVALLQALLATTKLTKVALPSFGDLIQTYQNSGFKSSALSAIRRFNKENYIPSKKAFGYDAKRAVEATEKERYGDVIWSNRRYNGLLEREMKSWMIEANPANRLQLGLQEYQRKFFETVQLGRITRFAREYAFDAGAIRAWKIGQKINKTGKVSQSLQKEISSLGLTLDNVRYLSKFKNMNEIQGDKLGERFIRRAGIKSADRDALIPTVGNRRLFSQSRNPSVRFLGSFLSWAQAKSSQTNSLISRLENGDAWLGVRMLGALNIYSGIRYAQLQLNPSKEFRKDTLVSESRDIGDSLKQIGDTIIFSASVMPWYLDKVVNEIRYDYGSTPVSGLAPVLELMDDLVSSGAKTVGSLVEGDVKDAAVSFAGKKGVLATTVPFYKDFERYFEIQKRMGPNYIYYGFEGDEEVYRRGNYFKGGEVSKENPVPNAAPEPSERINPYTGQPYEAEMERLGFKDGLLVSIGVAPVSDKEINKLKKSLKKRQAKRNGGKATRNYRKEYDNYHSSEKQKKDRAHRNNANRQLKREGRIAKGDGKDVDHKDGNPRNNSPSNLRTRSKNTNRSFSRRLKARNGGIKKAIKDYFRVEELKQEIREREGFREGAYKPDPTEEHYTIGYGFYDPDIKENDRMTREQAEERLDKEVNKRIEKIYKDIPGIINFSPSAQKALFSETYRGSLTAEGSPKTIALINEGRYMDAGKEFLNNDEYRNAKKLNIRGIRPRMEAVRDELFKMDAGFQKQQSDFYQSVVPYGQQ